MAKNSYRVEDRLYEADDLVEARDDDGSAETHRKRIEPWLSALFQSEHLNVLLGSGFSLGLASAAGADGLSMATTSIHPELDVLINRAAAETAKKMGRGKANVEDQFRSALALETGLGVLNDARHGALTSNIHRAFSQFANSVIAMEQGIVRAGDKSEANKVKFERLLSQFLLSFASRTASRDRLHVFTTNYDRLIERGFDLIAARPIDRFVGALTPRFRASRFDVDVHYTPPVNGRDRINQFQDADMAAILEVLQGVATFLPNAAFGRHACQIRPSCFTRYDQPDRWVTARQPATTHCWSRFADSIICSRIRGLPRS